MSEEENKKKEVNIWILIRESTVYKSVRDKIVGGAVIAMLGIGGTFLYSTGKDLWNLPETVRQLKKDHTQDSTRAVIYIHEIDSMKKVLKNHAAWIEEDYLLIQKIKTRLKIK